MKKIVYSALFATGLLIASCTDRDTVDRNPGDGVFNGGHPAHSDNHDDVNNTNGTGKNIGNNASESVSTTPNEAQKGNDTDIHNDSTKTNHNTKQ